MRNTTRIPGGMRRRLAEITVLAERVTPHTPSPLPLPDAAHYRSLAATKRREADSIARHIPGAADDLAARFARRQVRDLLAEADSYDQMAGADSYDQAGGAS